MPIDTNGDRNTKTPEPRTLRGSLLSFLLFLFLFNLAILPFFSTRPTKVLYSKFLQQVQQDKVAKVLIGEELIRYSLKDESSSSAPEPSRQPPDSTNTNSNDGDETRDLDYVTTPVATDTDLVQVLKTHNVEFGALPPQPLAWLGTLLGWIVPPLLFIGVWLWILSRLQGAGPAALTVGKSKARIYSEGHTGVTFADVAGVDEAQTELQEIIEFLKNPTKYTQIGAKIPKGVLLVGPPGTGKTLLAKAVAGEANVPFFNISGSEFVELFVGVGAARVRDMFEQAKQHAPCIVFIDELDALGKSRSGVGPMAGRNDEQEQTLNQLLTEMDGFEANSGVIILAATNRPEVLDPALLRPGRFDRQVLVDRPDKSGRAAILQVHVRQVQLAAEIDLAAIAARTSGFTGADLANLVNEAALLAARQDRTAVTMADFGEAFERVIAGLEKKSRVLNQTEKTTVAHHEMGHAIVASLMPGTNKVEKISIIPRGIGALGYTLQLPEEDRFLMMEDEIRGRIATLLAGRSAEETIFGKVSTGASDDIQKATDLAERAVTMYGMSQKLGPVAIERVQQQFLEGWQNPRRAVGSDVTRDIDQEVKQMVEGAHQMALRILETNLSVLKDASQQLLRIEVLEGEALHHYLKQVQAPPELEPWLHTGHWPQTE